MRGDLQPRFTEENTAGKYLEAIYWPDGPVCPHCGEQRLHRYLVEFEFRYDSRKALGFDGTDRTIIALKGIKGKRLAYLPPISSPIRSTAAAAERDVAGRPEVAGCRA